MNVAAAPNTLIDFGSQLARLVDGIAGSERTILLGFVMVSLGAMLAWPVLKIAIAASLSMVTLQLVQSRG